MDHGSNEIFCQGSALSYLSMLSKKLFLTLLNQLTVNLPFAGYKNSSPEFLQIKLAYRVKPAYFFFTSRTNRLSPTGYLQDKPAQPHSLPPGQTGSAPQFTSRTNRLSPTVYLQEKPNQTRSFFFLQVEPAQRLLYICR